MRRPSQVEVETVPIVIGSVAVQVECTAPAPVEGFFSALLAVGDLTPEDWERLIRASTPERRTAARAVTFLKAWGSYSKPVLLKCSDGKEYVAKGLNAGRSIVTEQVVGRLGAALGAPVPEVGFVEVPTELTRLQPELNHFREGLSHASVWIPDCTDRAGLAYTSAPENRERFALLLVLYSWVGAQDHQWIYKKAAPNTVFSVDHGHFLPGGPNWKIASLQSSGPAGLDSCFAACLLTAAELKPALNRLEKVQHDQVAAAIAMPPDEWGLAMEERIALATYLVKRQEELLKS